MYNLLRSDFMKISKSMAFKILFLSVCVLSVITALSSLSYVGSPYAGSLEITFTGYDAFFVSLRDTPTLTILCVILVGLIVCNDFDNRTLQASIYAGHSRLSVMASKCIVLALSIAIVIMPYPIGRAIVQGLLMGFGPTLSATVIVHMIATYLTVIIICFSLTSVSIFLAFVIRKTIVVMASSIVLLLLGTNALLSFGTSIPALGSFLAKTPVGLGRALFIAEYAPPDLLQAIGVCSLCVSIIIGLTYWAFRRAELK